MLHCSEHMWKSSVCFFVPCTVISREKSCHFSFFAGETSVERRRDGIEVTTFFFSKPNYSLQGPAKLMILVLGVCF